MKGIKIFLTIFFFAIGLTSFANVIYQEDLRGANIEIGNLLKWSTNKETNNKAFVVERSENGTDFEKIGEVKGNGTIAESQHYEFLDINVHNKDFYYRLRQVDFDGTPNVSGTLRITSKHTNSFMVNKMSNTITNATFEVILEVFQTGFLTYELLDFNGKSILNETLSTIPGFHKINVDLEFLPKGNYHLSFEMGEEKESLVLQKMNKSTDKNGVVSNKQ